MKSLPMVHCRICKENIDRNTQFEDIDWIMPSKNFFYHISCYKNWQNEKSDIHSQGTTELWKDAVWQYMTKELKTDIQWNKFDSQWDTFTKRGMTPKGIYFALRFFYEKSCGDPRKCMGGIGIVGSIYEEAVKYWHKREYVDKGIVARIEQQIMERQQQEIIIIKRKKKDTTKRKGFNLTEAMNLGELE